MSCCDILQEELLREKSTYADDYRPYPICNKVEDSFKCIEKALPGENVPPPPPVDYETLRDHTTPVPFSLYHRPTEIVKTNPHCYNPQFPAPHKPPYQCVPCDPRPELMQPFSCYAPAFPLKQLDSMLDNNKDVINSIRNFTFLTTYGVSYTPLNQTQRCANCVPRTTFRDSVKNYCIDRKPLPLGWRNAARQWDHRQTRAVCDPTCAFWHCYNKEYEKMKDCYQNMYEIDSGVTNKIKSLAHNWRLTEPYTTPLSTYAGYLPNLPKGVCMEKGTWCTHDPRISSNQAYRVRMDAHGMC